MLTEIFSKIKHLSFRVWFAWVCLIYRMRQEDRHMIEMEPDTSLLFKYIKGSVSEEEKCQVEKWLLTDKENERTLLQIADLYYAFQTQERILSRDTLTAYRKVQKRITKSNRRIGLYRISIAAACFLGVLILSTAIAFRMQQFSIPNQQFITVRANMGMRTSFDLPDGSVVYLNSGSTLSYLLPYNKDERRVTLVGEGYFKVAHNPEKPFIVSVSEDKMQVRVLGTEFNLQAYENDDIIQTTLVNGSVSLEMKTNRGIRIKEKLVPSEKAVCDLKTGHVLISNVNTVYETGWVNGRLMFKDLPLPEVLKKLSYFYNVRFEIEDSVINTYCFTGVFENKQLNQVLEYLKISSQIDYAIKQTTRDDSEGIQHTVVILKKKK